MYQHLKTAPETRYREDKKHRYFRPSSRYMRSDKDNGYGYGSPTCRYYPETGRIEDAEVIEYYKDYRRYEEVTKTFKHNEGMVTDDK